jgi:hypothetical protein
MKGRREREDTHLRPETGHRRLEQIGSVLLAVLDGIGNLV